MSSKREEFDAQDIEPRGVDRGIFNEKSLGVSSSAADWRKSPAGRDFLAGNNGGTIVPRPAKPAK